MSLRFLRNESGATAIEYGLIIALIFLVIVASPVPIGQALSDMIQQAADGLG
jgi:pilus assembly protein Flp/PilA